MIQVVNQNTLPSLIPERTLESAITIYASGRIRLSSGLAREMKVSAGDMVAMVSIDGQIYVAKEEKGVGFLLSGGEAPHLQRIDLVTWLKAELDLPIDKVRRVKLPVATAPQYINGFHLYRINPDHERI